MIEPNREVVPAEAPTDPIRRRQHLIRHRVGSDDAGQPSNRQRVHLGTPAELRNPRKSEQRTATGAISLSSEQTRLQAQPQPNDNHKLDIKIRRELERKTLKDDILRGLPTGHLRLKRAAGTPRETVNEWARNSHWIRPSHWSNSLNFIPKALRSVITVVSSSNCPKSLALANARLMFTDSNSCMR